MKKQLLCVAAFLFVLSLQAQVGIGTKTPSKSAELTITSNDKGLLIPSIPLKTTNDTSTISNGNVESLLVYANKKQGDIEPGFYYWNKTKWLKLTVGEDVKDIVINNFEEIVKNETVQNILKTAGGNVFYDGNKFEYLDRSGARKELFFSTVVKANETVTTLVAGADGTYTYKSEDGTETIINIPNSVITQFENIIKDETVKNEITKLLGNSGGNVFYDGTNLEYKDANGDKKEVNLTDLIKTNETVTKLVDNNDGTFTYYNEKEIDQSGAPKPNTGLSFKVPSLDAPVLASFITSGTYTEKSYNYDTMTASSTAGIFMNTNAVQGELFRSTFKTNSNPANTKYLQVMFEVDSGITTIGGYIGNNEVYAKVEFRVLVNNKEVKRFVDKFYRYGGYNFGLNQAYDSYVGMVSLADVPNLSESNTVTITVRPASSTFHKNVGTNDGSIKAGANKAVTYKATGVVVQVFEK